ncbi:MAG TPA: HU family DNA-binding protein [Kiloniellales bacterium]
MLMAKKPTTRKSTAAKSKSAKKTKAAKPKAAKAKAAKPKAAKRAKKTAKRAKKTAKRSKASAKKPASKRAAPKAPARASATPSGASDKDHLISVIQSGTGASKKAAGDTLAALLDSVAASLKKNEKVQLVGFGSFDVVRRRARKGRNPATGAPIKIKASKGVRFKAGSKLKGSL